MSSGTLVFTPLYESTGMFATTPELAEFVTQCSVAKLARRLYVTVEVAQPIGINLSSLGSASTNPDQVLAAIHTSKSRPLRRVSEAVLFTKRPLLKPELHLTDAREITEREQITRGLNKIFTNDDQVKSISIVRTNHTEKIHDDERYVAYATHEIIHGLGPFDHCCARGCVMNPVLTDEQLAYLGNATTTDILCAPHSAKLDQSARLLASIGLYNVGTIC